MYSVVNMEKLRSQDSEIDSIFILYHFTCSQDLKMCLTIVVGSDYPPGAGSEEVCTYCPAT